MSTHTTTGSAITISPAARRVAPGASVDKPSIDSYKPGGREALALEPPTLLFLRRVVSAAPGHQHPPT
jgi:hypothetical protein